MGVETKCRSRCSTPDEAGCRDSRKAANCWPSPRAWKIGGSRRHYPARMPNGASADRLTVNDRGRPSGSTACGPCVARAQSRSWSAVSDPLLAKSVQRVQHSLWPGISHFHGLSRSGEVQARWCQPWVSASAAIQESLQAPMASSSRSQVRKSSSWARLRPTCSHCPSKSVGVCSPLHGRHSVGHSPSVARRSDPSACKARPGCLAVFRCSYEAALANISRLIFSMDDPRCVNGRSHGCQVCTFDRVSKCVTPGLLLTEPEHTSSSSSPILTRSQAWPETPSGDSTPSTTAARNLQRKANTGLASIPSWS